MHEVVASLALFVTLLVAVATHTYADPTTKTSVVLVLGDSISAGYGIQREQGWVHLLEQRLAALTPPREVVNASISGDTSGSGLVRLPGLLARHKPMLVIIELGANDGLRGYPTPRIAENLARMIALTQAAHARAVLVAMELPPNYGERYITAFRAVFRDVAAREQVPLVPFLLGSVALNRALMQSDGVHPTAAAQPQLLATAWPFVRDALTTSKTTVTRKRKQVSH